MITVIANLKGGSGKSTVAYLLLRFLERGDALLAIVVFGTAACDSGAYLIGSRLGRTKFAPVISPKKTWEGTIGGWIGGLAATVLLGTWLVDLPWTHGLILGAIVATVAPFGDLAKSMVKRQMQVKDFSGLIASLILCHSEDLPVP